MSGTNAAGLYASGSNYYLYYFNYIYNGASSTMSSSVLINSS
jgi:hypothetical protein